MQERNRKEILVPEKWALPVQSRVQRCQLRLELRFPPRFAVPAKIVEDPPSQQDANAAQVADVDLLADIQERHRDRSLFA